jgi:hypothetical protein
MPEAKEGPSLIQLNCNDLPCLIELPGIAQHNGGGYIQFTVGDIQLFVSGVQQGINPILFGDLPKYFPSNFLALNASVMEYLLLKPDMIPESWKLNERD